MTSAANTRYPTSNSRFRPGSPLWTPGAGCSIGGVCAALLFAALLAGASAVSLWAGETGPSQTNAAALNAPSKEAAAPPVVRRDRAYVEQDLLQLLTDTLQQQYVKDNGELELRLTQPWKTRTVPDEPITLKVLDMPTMGVTPVFIVRFELHTATENLGSWQIAVQARVWRDVWVAHSAIKRGEPVAEADVARERRDMLTVHEPLAQFAPGDATLELTESLQAGSLLLARSVKARPVIHRGQSADALLRDGALSVTMKVEVLEDGAPGQIIRIRNAQSRRDLRGKVLNEQTILVSL